MTQNQHPRSPGRYLMTLDFGWNTRNSQIPFLNETAIASISLVCQEWMEGNGSRSSENVFTSQFHLSCQLFLQEAFSSVFYMESRPGRSPVTRFWLLIDQSDAAGCRSQIAIISLFSTSSTRLCKIICNTSSCLAVIKCLIDDSTAASFVSSE